MMSDTVYSTIPEKAPQMFREIEYGLLYQADFL